MPSQVAKYEIRCTFCRDSGKPMQKFVTSSVEPKWCPDCGDAGIWFRELDSTKEM